MSSKGVSTYPVRAGDVFGRLTAQSAPFVTGKGVAKVRCLCSCGSETVVQARYLLSGRTRSCRCLRKTHGAYKTSEYRVWVQMKNRCMNPNNDSYRRYGGAGIKVDRRWLASFENFLSDMGRRPGPAYTLDRLENSKGYTKSNCRWATATQQQNNRLCNRRLRVDGVDRTLAEWAAVSKVPPTTIGTRLKKGWSNRRAVFLPFHQGKRWRTHGLPVSIKL